jgi:large conductance mechanosensitive channel
MLNEFKKFTLRGNVLDLAVGIILGSAFNSIVSSLVSDVVMPPIGLVLGNVDFANLFFVLKEGAVPGPYAWVSAAAETGAVTVNYGVFINTIVNFVIVAFSMFLLIRATRRVMEGEPKKEETPGTKECPHCLSTIAIKATRCAFCTSELS